MSDIIANAKQLLDGATPGPWHVDNSDPDWAQLVGPVRLDRNLITQDVLADVFDGISDTDLDLAVSAPELAKALAEETYEYTYHIKCQGEWEPTRNMETHRQDWWDDRIEVVETVELLRASGFETRIVRRRVSQPEVIEGT